MLRSLSRRGILTALAICLLWGGAANAQPKFGPPAGVSKNTTKILDLFKSVVAKAADSTVTVLVDGKQVALGTVVKADGYILTKDSELQSDKIAVKFKDGKELPATKIASHETWDLAVLKVDAKDLKPVTWSDSTVAPVGNWVATPAPSDRPVAIGVISVASRAMPPGPKIALPKDANNRGYLGIMMEDSESLDGVKVTGVQAKTPAEKAGLKMEDVIIAVDGKEVLDRETLAAVIGRHKPGETIVVRFRRGEKEDEVKVTLEKRPAGLGFDRGDLQNGMGTERSERRTGFPVALQHDTDLKASQCGGPLVDLDGRVIGINIARGGRTDSYALPTEAIKPLLADLLAGKSVPPRTASALLEKIKEARELVRKAEDEKTAAGKKYDQFKAALEHLQKAEDEKTAAEKRFEEARAALEKLLAEQKKEKK